MDDFTRRIARNNLRWHMQVGAVALPEIFPVLEGQMVADRGHLQDGPRGETRKAPWRKISRKVRAVPAGFTVVYRKTLTLSRELASELSYLEQRSASVLVDGVIEELKEKYLGPNIANNSKKCGTIFSTIWTPSRSARAKANTTKRRRMGCQGAEVRSRDPFRVYWRERHSRARRRRQITGHFRDHAHLRQIVRDDPARV